MDPDILSSQMGDSILASLFQVDSSPELKLSSISMCEQISKICEEDEEKREELLDALERPPDKGEDEYVANVLLVIKQVCGIEAFTKLVYTLQHRLGVRKIFFENIGILPTRKRYHINPENGSTLLCHSPPFSEEEPPRKKRKQRNFWTEEEREYMASLILQQSRLSWREVTDKVNAKYGRNKTPQSAKSHYLRAFPVPDIESMQTWTPQDEGDLLQLVRREGVAQLKHQTLGSKDGDTLVLFYRNFYATVHQWSKKRTAMLQELCSKATSAQTINWASISIKISQGRERHSPLQCRERYEYVCSQHERNG